ncbi:monocopper oxidase-like protein SKU5 [Rhododendron vialii]|uniref:monocopper oxidase-like protein SKU5 n=1 Tax=Rhododendron vialii TaxID=182163 RepID=UPI00265E35E9|nr:monocopper oxidase-like protein SKU5 [Rhododendron vialii]
MASYTSANRRGLIFGLKILAIHFIHAAESAEIFLNWHVMIDMNIRPVSVDQPVITINGMFPGPLINATTNDNVHVNVFNDMDEPLLLTWNGIQQRLNSWQDGVSGTNCPIMPGKNWTYVFQIKDQIGSFFYFPSINFHKAGGGFGPIRVNNREVIKVPFSKPEAEFDLLIGDWYQRDFKDVRSQLNTTFWAYDGPPDGMLMNGRGPYKNPSTKAHESFTVTQGKTYRFRISNVGTTWSINFRIQNHQMVVVETEGSYTNKITIESLDVHVGQSYSVLVTADQNAADYYMVASPKMFNAGDDDRTFKAIGVLHYDDSTTPPNGPLPKGPDPFDMAFSVHQAKSIRWNLTAGAARPNPQGTFNVSNVKPSQTFILQGSTAQINGALRYTVNNVSYLTPATPLKLADYSPNGSGVYQIDEFPVNFSNPVGVNGTFVVTGIHREWLEIVFRNGLDVMDSWHLDGFGFYVVGFRDGEWRPKLRSIYNLYDPVVRSTVQVYPGGWTAVYVYLDNPGMWNLRSQHLKNWYLGQEIYVRVYDADPDPTKERPPPHNILFCGKKIDPPLPPIEASPPLNPSPPPGALQPPNSPPPYGAPPLQNPSGPPSPNPTPPPHALPPPGAPPLTPPRASPLPNTSPPPQNQPPIRVPVPSSAPAARNMTW